MVVYREVKTMRAAMGLMLALLSVSTALASGSRPEVTREATVAAPSRFETFTVALPNLGVERTVRVYLPRGYTNCEGCRYPVVYFMDGQNVFDAATSYVGEWRAALPAALCWRFAPICAPR